MRYVSLLLNLRENDQFCLFDKELWRISNQLLSNSNLFLEVGGLKGEEELLDVVLPQLVDAACIDGTSKKLIHLVLGVQCLLSAAAMRWMEQ